MKSYKEEPKKVLVAIPTYQGLLPIDLVKYLDNIKVPTGRGIGKCYVTRTPIHMARNMILEQTIKGGYDYVIMCDDDQIPVGEDCFYNLLTSGRDMVSGLVRLRVKQENLNVLHTEIYNDGEKDGMKKYVNYTERKNNGLTEIGNAGSGLICLSSKVCQFMLEKYANQPFEQKTTLYLKLKDGTRQEVGYNDNNVDDSMGKPQMCKRVLSEDYLFFERAIRRGFKLYAHGGSRCIHLGEQQKIVV